MYKRQVCDLVSTGSTLYKNGLKEVNTILRSEACLAKTTRLSESNKELLDQLVFRIKTVLRAKKSKYVLMNVPDEAIPQITSLLPVLKSPSIIPLAKEGWSSLHTVINEEKFWEVIEGLKAAGAEGILVMPIEKMVV